MTNRSMTDLTKLAVKLATDGPVKVLPTSRMVKLLFNGVYLVETTHAVFVWEHPYFPQFYIPAAELREKAQHFTQGDAIRTGAADDDDNGSSGKDTAIAHHYTITQGDRSTDRVVVFAADLTGPGQALAGLAKVAFDAMDQWFEEDTPIFVHPKDPFKRIDILTSRRRVRVCVDVVVSATTTPSTHLHETGLPCRYYLPLTSVDPRVLRPSKTTTQCPYKGEAEYYSVEVNGKLHEDVVWYYNRPILESAMVVGLVCFYNEKVDIELDGEKLPRPDTVFTKAKPGQKSSLL